MMMALHFLAGRNRGQEFLLPEEGDLMLYRSHDDDVLVNDSSAPHEHAVIRVHGNTITLCDLGSEASTQVNRKKIEEAELKEGDRIRIGKVTCMLVAVNRYSQAKSSANVTGVSHTRKTQAKSTSGTSISGSIRDVLLVDLLQFICGSNKNGVLTLHGDHLTGKIYIKDGQICHASVIPGTKVTAKRVLFRLLRWKSGTYNFDPIANTNIPDEITDPTDILLMEGAQEEMMFSPMEAELPPPNTRVTVAKLAGPELKKLTPSEMLFLGLVRTSGTVQGVIDNHPEGDVKACSLLVDLMKRKVVVPG